MILSAFSRNERKKSMKKAYVKVKDNSVKSILKRPYIAATIIGAALCAVVLSMVMPQEDVQNETQAQIVAPKGPEQEQKPTPNPESEPVLPEATSKPEVITPEKSEISVPKQNETAVEETVSVGLFGKTKEVGMLKPVQGELLKPYSDGKPVKSKTMGDWRVHNGVDIRAAQGEEVLAPADGEIIQARMDGLTGATISIRHGNDTVSTVYNLENTEKVSVGQKVKAGDVIGTAGSTAKNELLEEPHIHFEVQVKGAYVNPAGLWK